MSFGDGTVLTNIPCVSHRWTNTGTFAVALSTWNDTVAATTATVIMTIVPPSHGMKFVNAASPSPQYPYTNWTTAARTIQDAVDSQTTYGGWVLVTNGIYSTGTRVTPPEGVTSNRLVISNQITVASVNGPDVTTILGSGPTSDVPVRCVFMTAGTLAGFTLKDGCTPDLGYDSTVSYAGGGVYAAGGTLSNCIITGCYAPNSGGGAMHGIFHNCTLSGNSTEGEGGGVAGAVLKNCGVYSNNAGLGGGAARCIVLNSTVAKNKATGGGGGAAYCAMANSSIANNNGTAGGGLLGTGATSELRMVNCTIAGNSATRIGGGAKDAALRNCIVYYNQALTDAEYADSSLEYSCSWPLPASGSGSISNAPQLLDYIHIAPGSPCVGAGHASHVTGRDINGDEWAQPPAMGCDEPSANDILAQTGSISVGLSSSMSTCAVNKTLFIFASVSGRMASNILSFGDGFVATNILCGASWRHAWSTGGLFQVQFTAYNRDYPAGVTTSVFIRVYALSDTIRYVWTNSPTPTFPYTNWNTAARSIQDAVDAQSIPGGLVLVTDGVYRAGSRMTPNSISLNRVCISNDIVLASVNGPSTTCIEGAGPLGTTAVRCVYIQQGSIAGFTLSNGFTRTTGDFSLDQCGGGLWGGQASISNCTVVDCRAAGQGGGIYSTGEVAFCRIERNSAVGGGGISGSDSSWQLQVRQCVLASNLAQRGAGAYYGVLTQCLLAQNVASNGGGAYNSVLEYCVLTGNVARGTGGGGAAGGALRNCWVVNNLATNGANGGGVHGSRCYSCLLMGNAALSSRNGGGCYEASLYNCTIVGNSAYQGGGAYASASYLELANCIVVSNSAIFDPNVYIGWASAKYCCFPGAAGSGNINANPRFADYVDGDFHLATNSPCVDMGTNQAWMLGSGDLDGRPRIIGARVDMGAFELSAVFIQSGYWAWAASITNGLTNGTDFAVADGYPNLLKYATGSSPTQTDELAQMRAYVTNGLFALRFNRNTNATDVSLFVEATGSVSNGAPWQGIATNLGGSWGAATNVTENGGGTPVSVTVTDPAGPTSNRYLRLRVTTP